MTENPHELPVVEGEDRAPHLPETTSDAYVPHTTPEPGTLRGYRLLVWGVLPIVLTAVAVGIWIIVSH